MIYSLQGVATAGGEKSHSRIEPSPAKTTKDPLLIEWRWINTLLCYSVSYLIHPHGIHFESRFQTTGYKEHLKGLGIKGSPRELSFEFKHGPRVRKLGMRTALAVNAANTLHGYLDVTNRTNFQIGAPSIFLESLLRSLIFSHTWDIEICLVNRLIFAFMGSGIGWAVRKEMISY